MFTICIENLDLRAVIGILDFERLEPQRIIVNCFIEYEKDTKSFINYAEVVSIIETMLIEQKYGLVEEALEDIIQKLSESYKEIKTIKLKLQKPQIFENCVVGVELFRKI